MLVTWQSRLPDTYFLRTTMLLTQPSRTADFEFLSIASSFVFLHNQEVGILNTVYNLDVAYLQGVI